jgi:hypothetical protein
MTRSRHGALALTIAASLLAVGAACPKKDPAPPPAPAVEEPPPPAEAPPPPPPFTAQPEGARVVLLYTASVQGYVTPCGCTADPLGGVARLAAAHSAARAAYGERVIFLDAGDLLFEKLDDNRPADVCQAEARTRLLLDTYAGAGLAATVLGPLDDVRGAQWRDERLAARKLRTVGVPDAGRALVAGAVHEPGVIVDAGGVKIGVTGFRVDDAARVDAAKQALGAEVDRLWQAGAQAVVALSQAPRALVPQIASGIAGLDVVIQGREPGELPREPEALGDTGTWWVAAGAQAQHLGIVELSLDDRAPKAKLALDDRDGAALRRARLLDKKITSYEKQLADTEGARRQFVEGKLAKVRAERASVFADARAQPAPAGAFVGPRALALTRGSDEDAAAKAALDAYEAAIPDLVKKCEADITCPEPAEGAATYVGVEACFNCHKEAVKQWRAMSVEAKGKDDSGAEVVRQLSHANAWQTLKRDGKHKDRSCVGCHSVGFDEPGGYCKTSEVDWRENVQCESCHGPGSKHVKAMGSLQMPVKKVEEAVCRRCHHVPHIPTTDSFVFEDKLLHVLGPGHGEARWRALGGK